MTKVLIFIAITLVLILAICILSQWYVLHSAQNLHDSLIPVAKAIEEDNWQQARDSFALAKEKWQDTVKIWKIIINHQDMKDVEMSFVDLEAILEQDDRNHATQELATLFFFIDHVPENERINIGNLL